MLLYYANNGLSFRRADPSLALLPGEIAFDHQPSEDDLAAAFPGRVAALAVAAAPQRLAAALAAGIVVASVASAALNGTYAVDVAAQRKVSAIAAGIASRGRLPGGGATFTYPEMSGALHTFASADFLNLAAVIEDYVYALETAAAATAAGESVSWPEAAAAIA